MLYPINLCLTGRACTVVGGGAVALRKVRRLLAAGATVTVAAPAVCEELATLIAAGQVRFSDMAAGLPDFCGSRLVICAAADTVVNAQAAATARAAGALVNMAAPPLELGDFELPAAEAEGDILLTVSTGGRSPELARRLRERLLNVAARYSEWLEVLAPYREGLKRKLTAPRERENFWRQVLDDRLLDLVEQGNFDEAEELIIHALDSIGS